MQMQIDKASEVDSGAFIIIRKVSGRDEKDSR